MAGPGDEQLYKGKPDDGIVYWIDKQQLVSISSLRILVIQLTTAYDQLDNRLDEAIVEILVRMQREEEQAELIIDQAQEIVELKARLNDGQAERNRSVEWSG